MAEVEPKSEPTRKETATAYGVLTLLAFIVIAVWCTWHGGRVGETPIEGKVVLTWVWVGLLPACVLAVWAGASS